MRPIGVVENELAQCTLNHSILCMLCVQPQQIQVSLGTFWEIQRKLCLWSCLVYFSDWFIKWWEVECWLVNRKIAASRKRLTLPIRHKKGDTDKKCNICNKVHGTLYCTTDKNRKLVWTFVLKALFVKHCCCCSLLKKIWPSFFGASELLCLKNTATIFLNLTLFSFSRSSIVRDLRIF